MDIMPLASDAYATLIAMILLYYIHCQRRKRKVCLDTFRERQETDFIESPSLHPVINLNKCTRCGSCFANSLGMPAHQVLELVGRKATMINPTESIGHCACKISCPVDAITLVFGTERRGIDIPNVKPNFETNIPGIFIVSGQLVVPVQ